MEEQLRLELTDIEVVDELTSLNDEVDNGESLLYKNRLKNIIKDIAKFDEFEGIQCTKDGIERLQVTSKYLITMLIFNIMDELKRSGRKQIKPIDVDNALDKILANSSAIDTVLEMLKGDIKNLRLLNNITAVSKTNKFINDSDI